MTHDPREAQHAVERIILRRIYERRIEGYTIETAKEIVGALRREAPASSGVNDDEVIGDAATLRGFINTYKMTPSMMASEMEIWKGRALAAAPSRHDAGGGVRLPQGYALVPTKPTPAMIEAGCEQNPTQWNEGTDLGFAADVANDVYVAMVSAAALSTPPAAVESNASVEARLREALERVRSILKVPYYQDCAPLMARRAYNVVEEALSAVGDEAKKSIPVQDAEPASGAHIAGRTGGAHPPTGASPSSPTAERQENARSPMQRLLDAAGWDAGSTRHKQLEDALDGARLRIVAAEDSAEWREIVARFKSVVQIMRSANKQGRLMCIWNSDIETMDAILAALDGGAGA